MRPANRYNRSRPGRGEPGGAGGRGRPPGVGMPAKVTGGDGVAALMTPHPDVGVKEGDRVGQRRGGGR